MYVNNKTRLNGIQAPGDTSAFLRILDRQDLNDLYRGGLIEGRIVGNSKLLQLVLIYYCWFRVDAAAKD
ncbi:hypothetical protein Tco_0448680 [Tanacetum coccineum]